MQYICLFACISVCNIVLVSCRVQWRTVRQSPVWMKNTICHLALKLTDLQINSLHTERLILLHTRLLTAHNCFPDRNFTKRSVTWKHWAFNQHSLISPYKHCFFFGQSKHQNLKELYWLSILTYDMDYSESIIVCIFIDWVRLWIWAGDWWPSC